MPFDEELADRVRLALRAREGVSERKMFGGLAFLRDGKMFCGVHRAALMAHIGPARYSAALARPHVRPMDFTGRPFVGYVFVDAPGLATTRALQGWVDDAWAFVGTLAKA